MSSNQQEQVARAILRRADISPRKVRGVANLIRGRAVADALAILRNTPRKSARMIEKLVFSALANAENNHGANVDALVVANCTVNHGPIVRKWLPRAMGRADRILHRTSHVEVVLAEG